MIKYNKYCILMFSTDSLTRTTVQIKININPYI